ncbi:MAG: transketolase C-terminal domain-containing protein, partial [Rhodothermales bacterium]
LEQEGYSAEVIDPRTIRPLDIETIQESVRKTNRLVVVDESNPFASFSSEVTYQVQERLFDYLDSPVIRVTAKDVPAPYAKNLIEYYMPRVEEIVAAAKKVMYAK